VLNMGRNPQSETWWHAWSLTWVRSDTQLGIIYGMSCIAALESLRIFVAGRLLAERNAFVAHMLFVIQVSIWTILYTFGHYPILNPIYNAYPLCGPC
jgi:hypothetical protein